MVVWWLCWHRTILIRNITQKQYSQFTPVHDFWKPWWGVAYVPCMTNLRALYAWHMTCMLSLAGHWQGRRALSNHVCAHSVISMWHVVCLQHLARASSEQSRSTTVLPINHVIQMPQCLPRFVNHDYWSHAQTVAWTPAHLAYIAKNANLSPAPVALKHQNTNAKSLWLDRTKRQTPHMYARWLTIGLVKEKVVQVY